MTLDATIGTPTANSYATVADADAYLAVRGNTSAWTALDPTQKEAKLQWAALWLDTLSFSGTRGTYTQALQWPRVGVVDRDGYYISGLPAELKKAQSELAFRLISEDWTQGLGSVTNETMGIGSISMGRETYRPFPATVLALLRPFLAYSPGSCGRLVRG